MAVALREDSLATLGAVHLGAMRVHDRKVALLCREGDRWEETPDWRLDRHVIRLGLYLAERAGVLPGERVAVAAPLRRESLLVDLAAAVQGIVPVALDRDLSPAGLASALAEIAPRAIFASARELEQLARAGVALEGEHRSADGSEPGEVRPAEVIAFDAPSVPDAPSASVVTFSEVLDLGGTLDTAERAVAFRGRAREVAPDRAALAWVESAGGEPVAMLSMTHREVTRYLRALWSAEPARTGDLAYLSASGSSAEVRLALLAFLGDGHTTVALGTAGREAEEIAALRPHKIVVPPAALDAAQGRGSSRQGAATALGVRRWLERAARAPARYLRRGREEERGAAGRHARWIRSTAALPAAAVERARAIGAASPGLDGPRGGAP